MTVAQSLVSSLLSTISSSKPGVDLLPRVIITKKKKNQEIHADKPSVLDSSCEVKEVVAQDVKTDDGMRGLMMAYGSSEDSD